MALHTEVVEIDDDQPYKLSDGGGALDDPRPVLMFGEGESGTYFLGGENVTAETGMPVSVGAYMAVAVMYGDDLYAISETGPLNIRVMRGRVAPTI